MKIGIAGVGRMGAAIGARLIESGHALTVWNRSADKLAPLVDKGAATADSPKALASSVETVITILTDAPAIERVYEGSDGLLAGDLKGKLVIEMSTVPPQVAPALAEKVRAKGAAFVECPVGGSVLPASQGKLLGLVGGEAADVARAQTILDQLCRATLHAGPVGSGALLKFTVNLPLMVYWQALGESLALARSLPVDPAALIAFLTETSGAANVMKQRGQLVAKAMAGEAVPVQSFHLDGGLKDVEAMLAEAKRQNLDLPVLQAAANAFQDTRARKGGGIELTTVAAFWRDRTPS